jgi:hypothetical protein
MPLVIVLAVLWLLQSLLILSAASEKELSQLSRVFALRVRIWLFLVKTFLSLDAIITDGKRTPAEQNAQHAANAKNPAYSATNPGDHILGEAVDVNFSQNGVNVLRKANSPAAWAPVVKLAALCGISWGGNFKTYAEDRVHFYV